MASNPTSQGQAGHPKRTSFNGLPGGSASMFLDRSKAGIRGSTPDSEALASSDDEQDHHHRLHQVTSNPGPLPTRRASWLTETQQAQNRKNSFGINSPFSPASPNALGPSSDQTPWGNNMGSNTASTLGRGHPTSASFPWGSPIWNSDSQKGPPQRLTEVLPSPTSMVPPGSAGLHSEEPLHDPSHGQENTADSAIPFAIPLQPTLKTYRSQSYSVGQLDLESSAMPPPSYGGHTAYGRPRNGAPYSGLQHRPSRPSMLGDLSHDPTLLGQLREIEDDESSNDSESGVPLSTTQTIEQLTMENALLRQVAAEQLELGMVRNRKRSVTGNAGRSSRNTTQSHHQHLCEDVPEGSEYALYDMDEPDGSSMYRQEPSNGRSSGDYATKSTAQYTIPGIPENRALESVKKGHWQSSLGFGGIGEPPQSRRHSFADIPTSQNSIGSVETAHNGKSLADLNLRSNGRTDSPGNYGDNLAPSQGDGLSYFSRTDSALRSTESHRPALSPIDLHQAYMQNQHIRPQHLSPTQTRPIQLLYMVTFKAQRADVFYVQEGTGLHVKKGDLVIVEADRGADLGTVATDSIPFVEAKELKDKYMQEHFTWLMIFSRHGQNGTVAGPNPNGQSISSNSAIGRMGGSPSQTGTQDLPNSEIKPKVIKRLAQNHEIQTLRDKEGNEAKAKRVCQQKVVEHRLNMEILEAEFQMDWKKLTFYYFADEYINFNSLVTDLFKIYKTRIWMSAINPASFQTPLGGLQIPGGVGSNSFGGDNDQYHTRRQQRHNLPAASNGSNQAALDTFDHAWNPSRDSGAVGGTAYPQLYAQSFPSLDLDIRQLDQYSLEYRQGLPHVLNMQTSLGSPNYNTPSLHHSSSFTSRPNSGNSVPQPSQVLGTDWNQAMRGLSLSH